ncbi:MAG: hypothetical protein ACPGO5_01910 [Patescibacteria group bacterium]
MLEQKIKEILVEAVEAPSGDNSQPWRFRIKNDVLFIKCTASNDNEAYNYQKRGSLVAVGALLENIRIISSYKGYGCNLFYFPDKCSDIVAKVEFTKSEKKLDENYESIKNRFTDRRPYLKNSVQDSVINTLKSFSDKKVFVKVVSQSTKVNEIAKLLSYNEMLILENKFIRSSLLSSIVWKERVHKEKRKGLYIRTLALEKEKEFVFRLLLNFDGLARLAKILGLTKLISKDSAGLYSETDSYILLSTTKNVKKQKLYLDVGILLQRIWLHLTSKQLSLQPVAALIYLRHRINENRRSVDFLSRAQSEKVLSIYDSIKGIFNLEDEEEILMLSRIGKSVNDTDSISRSYKSEPTYY